MTRTLTLPLAMWALLSAGCGWNGPRTDTAAEGIREALDDALASQAVAPPAPPPQAVTSALMPAITVQTARVADEAGQRFEIAVNDAPARQFFMSLVEGTPFNMVVHPDVDGAISLDLKNVTIPQVMEVVRSVYGYEYRRTALGFEVLPARLQSRIFRIDYLNMVRGGHSQTRVSSGQVSQGGSGETVTDDRSTTTNTRRQGMVTGTQINTVLPETTFWSELQNSIDAILASLPGRSAVVNAQSGVVVVRAMPGELREVEQFLAATQSITQRQVVLEAKVIEVELDDAFREGINWAAMFGDSAAVGQTRGRSVFDTDAGGVAGRGPAGGQPELPPGLPQAFGAFGGVFSVALSFDNFKAFVELLDQQGTVHVLSSPRISAINNQKAVIKVGTDEFFVTDISSTTTTGAATTTTPSVELTPFFSGIALDVTPQISAAGMVTLHVHPSISEVRDQEKTITIGDVSQTLPLAQSTVRESDTVVQAQSGQVVVIGGLMQERFVDDTSDTPLGLAPFLRYISSHKRQLTSRSELVILLRPIVVESGQQWASVIRESSRNIDRIHGTAARLQGYGPAPESVVLP